MADPPTGALDELWLADWRRRVAALYGEVRRAAADDPEAAWDHWRAAREALFRGHPQSPVPPGSRSGFRALHYPYDPAARFEVPLEAAAPAPREAAPLALPSSGGSIPPMRRVGWVDVPFAAGTRRLSVFWLEEYSGGLFLPFRDATSGTDTYGAGRYLLDTAKGADLGGDPATGTLVLDFNFAFHPSCAFDPRWSCPLAPPENRLDLPVRAGERLA